MAEKVDREGVFRAKPVRCTLHRGDNGAISWAPAFEILEWYDPEIKQWHDFQPYKMEFLGFYLLSSNAGKPQEVKVKTLAESLGWDGQLEHLIGDFDTVQITLRNESYNGQTMLRLQWVAPADSEPRTGGLKQMDAEAVAALGAQFNSQFRALAGQVQRKAPTVVAAPPISGPPKPPPAKSAPPF
jgi:hypothetical protein